MRRKIVDKRNTKCIELRKFPIHNEGSCSGVPPKNIDVRSAIEVLVANIRNVSPKLKTPPRFIRVVEIPEAIPRVSGVTEFMIEALFGAIKRPIPAPIRIKGIRIC